MRPAEHRHHMFSNTKQNRRKYGKLIDHTGNIMYLCSICHLNKSIPKMKEREFRKKMGFDDSEEKYKLCK